MATINQRNTAFDAGKAKLFEIINDDAGSFASTIEGKLATPDILAVVDVVLAAPDLPSALAAAKAKLYEIIENKAGFFSSTIEGDLHDDDIAAVVTVMRQAANV